MAVWVKLFVVLLVSGLLDVCFGVTSTKGGSKFHLVEDKTDLWRFLVAQGSQGLTIGNTHLCILSYKSKFLASRQGNVYHDRDWCKSGERFAINFLEDNKVTLQPLLSDQFVSCMDSGSAILQASVGVKQKFELSLNANDDQLAFYNTYQKKYIVAKEDGTVRCDSSSRGTSAMFMGWRGGPKDVWVPREEGRLIRKFNNAKGTATRTFKFKKTIGVKVASDSKAKVRVDEPMIFGTGLAKKFKIGYASELQMNWADEDAKVWQKATVVDAAWNVEPGMIVTLYQAVGIYGPLEIYSDYFMEREEEAGPTQAQESLM